MDTVSPERRSQIMRAIKSKGTRPERRMRAALAAARLDGFRCNVKDMPGKPDFVFAHPWVARVAVFVEGCFWHGCPVHYKTPKSNVSFWSTKVKANIARDQRNEDLLRLAGWTVLRLWECQVEKRLAGCVELVRKAVERPDG